MLAYYKRSSHPSDEKDLSNSIANLQTANPESLVEFLHTTLSNVCSLMIRPSTVEESFDIPSKSFEALASIVQRVSNLSLPTDKHDRNLILASYIQYVFDSPRSQAGSSVSATFEGRNATITKSRVGSGGAGDENLLSAQAAAAATFKKGGSVRGTKGISFNGKHTHAATRLLSCIMCNHSLHSLQYPNLCFYRLQLISRRLVHQQEDPLIVLQKRLDIMLSVSLLSSLTDVLIYSYFMRNWSCSGSLLIHHPGHLCSEMPGFSLKFL